MCPFGKGGLSNNSIALGSSLGEPVHTWDAEGRGQKRDSWEDLNLCLGLPRWLSNKESAVVQVALETGVRSLGGEDPLEEEVATLSSILA